MQTALGLYCEASGHGMDKTYVWLDIFSIPQFHDGCKVLAVNSLYVYATAADILEAIAAHLDVSHFGLRMWRRCSVLYVFGGLCLL